MATATEGSAVPQASKGSWSTFLRSITSFSGDLSSLTAPPFILSSTSLTEFSAYWTEHPEVFCAPAKERDPAKRALLVLKWFITTLKQQYATRSENLGSEKKPLNPFLGELFLGKWENPAVGTTQLVSEQVSHHPPVTAYNIYNRQCGVRLQGYNGQKASISKTLTITVKQIGHALLHIDEFDEDYLITLPNLHIEGLLGGAPFVELNSTSHIVSSSGFLGKVEYSGRGWISGKKNSFSATLSQLASPKTPLYTLEGQWTEAFTIKEGKGGKSGKVIDEWNPAAHKTTPLTVAPVESQDPMESRRAWQKVALGIQKSNMDEVHAYKSEIEENQRALRKQEKEQGTEWQRRYFTKVSEYPKFEKMARSIGEAIDADKTGGVWRWDVQKSKVAMPPFDSGI